MIRPTPAIVAQSAVRRLPRLALILLCMAYVLPGYFGREPWKNADITAFGYMLELSGTPLGPAWLAPTIMNLEPEVDALLPYWLGAWAIKLAPAWLAPDFAARLPFGLMLVAVLVATWYGIYHLARSEGAQPVAFAFGGEAEPADYARAMADGGLLGLIGCLGLAQFSHETTPALAQLCFTALTFYGLSALHRSPALPLVAVGAGLVGLTLSGSPAVAVLLGAGGALYNLVDRDPASADERRPLWRFGAVLLSTAIAATLATVLDLWQWRIQPPGIAWREWRGLGRLFLWFTWPLWPLLLWTLWRWRHQLRDLPRNRHLALPLLFLTVAVATTLLTPASDRSLLLALPALATLAAFALPTLDRSVTALIDWFTLLFFSCFAIIIWVIWISMQTGIPRQPAANVAKLAPGFEPGLQGLAFAVALAGTLAWIWLVRWRVGRHRSAIWKSMVLPAGGATLCWLLLMTLWLPVLDYARSYAPMVQRILVLTDRPACVQVHGLGRGPIAALRFHGQLDTRPATRQAECPWLLVDAADAPTLAKSVDTAQWTYQARVRRPTDRTETILLYRRVAAP